MSHRKELVEAALDFSNIIEEACTSLGVLSITETQENN